MNVKRQTTTVDLDVFDVNSGLVPGQLADIFLDLLASANRLGGGIDWTTLTITPDPKTRLSSVGGNTQTTRPSGTLRVSVETVVVK